MTQSNERSETAEAADADRHPEMARTDPRRKLARRPYKIRGPETWALIRESYLAGASARRLAARYDVMEWAVWMRRGGWVCWRCRWGAQGCGRGYTLNDMVRVVFDAGYRTEVMRVDRDAEGDEDKALYWRLNLESYEADGRRQVELKTDGWREGRAELRAGLAAAEGRRPRRRCRRRCIGSMGDGSIDAKAEARLEAARGPFLRPVLL